MIAADIKLLKRSPWEMVTIHTTRKGIMTRSALGSTWLPGSIGPETGSLPATAAGCMVGWFVTLHAVYYGMLPWWTFPVIPSCGAVVGFNLTRHYKKNRAPTAALTAVPYLEMRYGTPILGMQLTIP